MDTELKTTHAAALVTQEPLPPPYDSPEMHITGASVIAARTKLIRMAGVGMGGAVGDSPEKAEYYKALAAFNQAVCAANEKRVSLPPDEQKKEQPYEPLGSPQQAVLAETETLAPLRSNDFLEPPRLIFNDKDGSTARYLDGFLRGIALEQGVPPYELPQIFSNRMQSSTDALRAKIR